MTAQPGWYPDPSGNTQQLRWWNGQAWTNDVQPVAANPATPAPAPAQATSEQAPVGTPEAPVEPNTSAEAVDTSASEAAAPVPAPVQPEAPVAAPAQPAAPTPAPAQPAVPAAAAPAQPEAPVAGTVPVQPSAPAVAPTYLQSSPTSVYPVSDEDQTKLLIAFIFAVISTVGTCWLIVPLFWCIPMTIHAWKIYKGQALNSTAFSVCMLLFVSLVSGILMLVSDRPGDRR